jgi:hypothetical protein
MPDDATPLIAGRSTRARATFQKSQNSFMYSSELLVTRNDFARFSVHLLEDAEVANQVQQMSRSKHARNKDMLALQDWYFSRRTILFCAAHRYGLLLRRAEEEGRTGVIGLLATNSS